MEDDENSKSVTIEALLKAKGYEVNDKVVIELLKRENLENQLQRKLIQLSSGQRRKLQLILAMIQLPEILLLDAPYVGLDEYSRNDLNNWLLELAENHDLQLIITAKLGDAPEWIENKIALSADYESNNNSEECRDALYNLFPKWKDESTRKTQIDLQQINVNYGKNIILEGLDLSVKEGDSIALIGANGAGKSTLLSLIYADNPKAYSNNVKMFGVKRGHGKSIWDIKKRIGFVSSELHLYFTEKYSCRKVIATGLFDTKFIPRKINAHEHQIIEHFAEYFNVKYLLDRNYPETSLCEQKLMLLIRALVKGPELLLLDEPYQAFSAELVAKANSLLNEIMKQSRTSLVFITHYKEEIPASVQKIYHLKEGKLHLETVR
jgi:molybdate transport system ATP-binding protein